MFPGKIEGILDTTIGVETIMRRVSAHSIIKVVDIARVVEVLLGVAFVGSLCRYFFLLYRNGRVADEFMGTNYNLEFCSCDSCDERVSNEDNDHFGLA